MEIRFLYAAKKTGSLFGTVEQAVKLNPLRTAQGRGLHVVGSLDDRYLQGREFAVTAAVLEGREKQGIGTERHDALDIWLHAGTAVGYVGTRLV